MKRNSTAQLPNKDVKAGGLLDVACVRGLGHAYLIEFETLGAQCREKEAVAKA